LAFLRSDHRACDYQPVVEPLKLNGWFSTTLKTLKS